MNKLYIPVLAGALLIGQTSLSAQVPTVTCSVSAAAPPIVRAEGKAELVSDILLVCTGGNPAAAAPVNLSVFLNTNITSNLTGPGADETEALVLIDEPQPSPALNISNGIPFVGQVKGTPPIIPSGNVFTGLRTGFVNEVIFPGLPLVPPGAGTRTFRITNLRALPPPSAAAPSSILAFIAVSGPVSVAITSPVVTVGFVSQGLNFIFATLGANLNLKFGERFASAFKKRIENGAGPLLPVKQNHPGVVSCTESGFNPDFTSVTPGATGSADTGTRLLAKITGIPFGIPFVLVPNDVTSSSGQLVAARIAPPYAPPFAGGVPIVAGGFGLVPVAGGTATVLYEVTAAAPHAGVNGCLVIESFVITAHPWPFGSLAGASASGAFAPIDPTPVISGPAPEPRFE